MLIFALAALVWFGGGLWGLSRPRRWMLIGLLALLAVLVSAGLPQGNPLRQMVGGKAQDWLLALVLGLAVFGYIHALRWLRAKAAGQVTPVEPAAMKAPELEPSIGASAAPQPAKPVFSDAELSRYSRHIFLREIGGPGQRALRDARMLVIGAGGLGAPALLYLAAAGVGHIGVIDDDLVEASNLQRQVIHGTSSIGHSKTASAKAAILALNPHVEVTTHDSRLSAENVASIFAKYDQVLDGSDSFDTRRLANAEAARQGKPLIGGALSQWEGQLSVWDPAHGAPCYACIFPEDPAPGLVPSCAEAGVLSPLPGVIGTMMAAEAIKIATGAGDPLRGRLLIWDALYAEARIIAIARRPDCRVCGQSHAASLIRPAP